jgi:hypothetical protein
VSDIKIELTWWQIALVLWFIGWPGLVLGAVGGGLAWRRHPLLGTVAGAVAGITLWVAVKVLSR